MDDELARASYRVRMRRHQKVWWRNRCRDCGGPWPCRSYRAAEAALALANGHVTLADVPTVEFHRPPTLTDEPRWHTNSAPRVGDWL